MLMVSALRPRALSKQPPTRPTSTLRLPPTCTCVCAHARHIHRTHHLIPKRANTRVHNPLLCLVHIFNRSFLLFLLPPPGGAVGVRAIPSAHTLPPFPISPLSLPLFSRHRRHELWHTGDGLIELRLFLLMSRSCFLTLDSGPDPGYILSCAFSLVCFPPIFACACRI